MVHGGTQSLGYCVMRKLDVWSLLCKSAADQQAMGIVVLVMG